MKAKKIFLSFLSILCLCFSILTITSCGENNSFNYFPVNNEPTEGLEYENIYLDQGDSVDPVYKVKGIGTATDKNIVIPAVYNNYPVTGIGTGAFEGCSSLTSITIPDSITWIGAGAFSGCSSLKSIIIPDSVTRIDYSAFYGCSSLKNIKIGSGVQFISPSFSISNIFTGCDSLEKIVVGSNNTKYDSRENCNAIIETETNTLILGCKNTEIPDSVTSIGNTAFAGCNTLKSITIPKSVSKVGEYAFFNCKSLTKIKVDKNNKSFYSIDNCNAIIDKKTNTLIVGCNNTKIPYGVISIGDLAFTYCSSLKSISIPDSVTSIGDEAFLRCSSIKSISIPDSVTSIGSGAFYGCSSLTSIIIPNSVTSIDYNVFADCSSLTSIIIPNSVTSIGHGAFYGCSSLTTVYYTGTKEQWNSITINNNKDYNDSLLIANIIYNYVPE